MNQISVLHSYSHWLPITMNWLHNQIKNLDEDISSVVFCDVSENEKAFPVSKLICLNENHSVLINKIIRKSGLGKWNFPLLHAIREEDVTIVHSHFGHTGWENMFAVKKENARHVVTFYGADVNYLPQNNSKWYSRYATLFENVDLVLAEGPFMRESLIALGCPSKKAVIQHLGVEVEKIPFQPFTSSPNEPLRVLIAASFREKKGIPYALEALIKCMEIPMEVTIIGGASKDRNSQAEEQKIQALAGKLGDKVTFSGFVSYQELQKQMLEHHIFLSPSVTASDGDSEGGSPLGITEACASGLFVISTDHCDIPNVVIHNETGLLAPERDSDTLAEHIRWFVEHPEKVQQMLQASRKHIEENFNAKRQGKKLSQIYRSLI